MFEKSILSSSKLKVKIQKKLVEWKIVRMQEYKNARMQECKIARLQDCKNARMLGWTGLPPLKSEAHLSLQ